MATTELDRGQLDTGQRVEPGRSRVDRWMGEDIVFSAAVIKKQSLILFLCRLPAFIPLIFIARGWLSLNANGDLTNTEADILGSGGELCFLIAVSITPIITMTGWRWIAPLRRWYAIFFAVIGISDATTASITTDFAGGVFGRLAGHTFLVTGFLIILLALPLLATANTPSQRKMGKYWKKLQRMTYVIWGFIILHLLLLDGFKPFGAAQGDGIPIFHDRFYQIVAISIPLALLRLPPIRRWVMTQRENGKAWKPWLVFSPLLVLYMVSFIFIINEEFFVGLKVITMTNLPSN
jgi:DMSO/TMAO reductase YedYZ heme-binding membrane subunit